MRTRAWVVLLLVLGGCGEDAPEAPRPEIVPAPADDFGEAESAPIAETTPAPVDPVEPVGQPEPAVPPPPLPVAEPGFAHVFVEDAFLSVDESLELESVRREHTSGPERSIRYPEVQHPDPRLGRLVNERLAAFAASFDRTSRSSDGGSTDCDLKLATRHLVTVICMRRDMTERGSEEETPSALQLRIDERGVYEMHVSEAFVSGTDLAAIVRDGCREEQPEDWNREDPRCEDSPTDYVIALGRQGLAVETISDGDALMFASLEIPYSSMASKLLASGPLALSLDRTDVETRAIAVSGGAASAPLAGSPQWAVMPMASLAELAAAWASLPADQRAGVHRAGGYLVAADEATARAVAATLGTAASEVQAPATDDGLFIVRTTREGRLRSAPYRDAEEVGVTLARGTILVTTQPSGGAGFVQAVAHADLEGFLDARHVQGVDPCVPDLAPFLATLPEDVRAGARTRTLRNALSEGSWGRATYVTEVGGASHVELRRIEAGCVVDRSLARFTRPGVIESLAITRSARRGGDSLIVTVTSEPSVAIHTFGDAEPAWTRALASGDRVETSRREADAWYPVVITPAAGAPLRLTWAEGGPVVAAAP